MTYQSQILFEPHIVVQMLVVDGPVASADERDDSGDPSTAGPGPG